MKKINRSGGKQEEKMDFFFFFFFYVTSDLNLKGKSMHTGAWIDWVIISKACMTNEE